MLTLYATIQSPNLNMKTKLILVTAATAFLSSLAEADSLTPVMPDQLNANDLAKHLRISPFTISLPQSIKEGDKFYVTVKGFKRQSNLKVSEVKSFTFDFIFSNTPKSEHSHSIRVLLGPERITIVTPHSTGQLKTKSFIPDGYSYAHYAYNRLEDGSFCLASFPNAHSQGGLEITKQDRWLTLKVEVKDD